MRLLILLAGLILSDIGPASGTLARPTRITAADHINTYMGFREDASRLTAAAGTCMAAWGDLDPWLVPSFDDEELAKNILQLETISKVGPRALKQLSANPLVTEAQIGPVPTWEDRIWQIIDQVARGNDDLGSFMVEEFENIGKTDIGAIGGTTGALRRLTAMPPRPQPAGSILSTLPSPQSTLPVATNLDPDSPVNIQGQRVAAFLLALIFVKNNSVLARLFDQPRVARYFIGKAMVRYGKNKLFRELFFRALAIDEQHRRLGSVCGRCSIATASAAVAVTAVGAAMFYPVLLRFMIDNFHLI